MLLKINRKPSNGIFKKYNNFLNKKRKRPFSTRHRRLIDVISEPTLKAKSEEVYVERSVKTKTKRDFMIAVTCMGFAMAGVLVNPIWGPLSIPGFVYITIPVYKKAFRLLKKGQVSVDTLSSISILTCLLNGYYVTLGVASITYRVSRFVLDKVTDDSRSKIINIFHQQPHTAWILSDGAEIEIPFAELKVGDIVVVNAGETIPVDGTIMSGIGSIDQRILTGESQPAEKEAGSQVFASTILLSGRICIQVEQAGEDTIVAKIGQILNNTAEFKTATELRAETMANRTVWPTLAIGAMALPFVGPMGTAAVVNAHFKHRMGIVAPISVLNYLSVMSQNGILIKDGRTLDLLNDIDTIVFDKTGTLTTAQPHVGAIYGCDGYDENEVLRYAAGAEVKQTHPIALAILEEAQSRQLAIPPIDDAKYKIGYGLTVTIEQRVVRVGSIRFIELSGIPIPPNMQRRAERCHQLGHSLVMVACNETVIGAIELQPTIRLEAPQIIERLRQRPNIQSMYIISGDHETPTRKLAHTLGIDHYFAETLPENKAQLIEELQAEGKSVCFVGDGINDSIALKKAQVSISLRGASTVATDTAQIILMDGSLHQLAYLFEMAEEFKANIQVSFITQLLPTIIGISGALFAQFTMINTVFLTQTGLAAGVINGILPLVKHREQTEPENSHLSNQSERSHDNPK